MDDRGTPNLTVNQNTSTARNEELAKIEITVQAAILTLAIVGNMMVLVVLGSRSRKLSRMNLLIVHLSLADLFVAFFNVLPQLIWDVTFYFYGNDFLCRFVKYAQVLGLYASSYVLVTTAVDRYLAICHPLTSHVMTTRRIHVLVLVAWLLSLAFSIPQLFIFEYREVAPGRYNCLDNFRSLWTIRLYITWFTLAVYVLPLVILITAYSCICYAVWRSTMTREPSIHFKSPVTSYQRVTTVDSRGRHTVVPRAHAHGRSVTKSKIKTAKLTFTVIICYVVCWGPFFISQMWAAWDTHAPFEGRAEDGRDEAMVIILLLASLNSCTNPWIYMAFSNSLHKNFAHVFCCTKGLRRRATWDSSIRSRGTEVSCQHKMASGQDEYVALEMEQINSLIKKESSAYGTCVNGKPL